MVHTVNHSAQKMNEVVKKKIERRVDGIRLMEGWTACDITWPMS